MYKLELEKEREEIIKWKKKWKEVMEEKEVNKENSEKMIEKLIFENNKLKRESIDE